MILCDSNVIIEIFKGNQKTLQSIDNIGINQLAISSITIMELYFGALNKSELSQIKSSLEALKIIHMDLEISKKAVQLVENYSKSHHLDIPDALIAATALSKRMNLFTCNIKDFNYINSLQLYSYSITFKYISLKGDPIMTRITFILALVLSIACSNSGEGKTNQKIDLKKTQKWLKGLGRNYTINQLKNLKKLDLNSGLLI